MVSKRKGPFSGLFAILYYEFLWNLRKKKFIGLFILVFAIVTLEIALPPILSNIQGRQLNADPLFVFKGVGSLNGIFIFLLAVASSMNTISGEFESGSIVPLLTKPVSRSTVFAGKMLMNFLMLLTVFSFLGVYLTIGGILIRGPQSNLNLVPLGILGLTAATTVWTSIIIFLGTFSKNSMVAALGSFGIYIVIAIVANLVAAFLGSAYLLFFAPGDGAPGSTGSCGGGFGSETATGTNALGYLLMQWSNNPNSTLNFCQIRFTGNRTESSILLSEPISAVAANALGVTLFYIESLLILSWAYFRHTEVLE